LSWSETHVVSWYEVNKSDYLNRLLPPVGKPIKNTVIYILDSNEQLCATGIEGELYIGGIQVARGYLNRPELTAERFITNPFGEGRLYRTGDRGRWLADGNIEFLGRQDDQVKIRGYRIEPAEIENVLRQSGYINQAVVLAKEDSNGMKRMVVYVVSEGGLNKAALLLFLRSKLPDYMVPALFVELEQLPLTVNGKIDKNKLPDPDISAMLNKQYEPPRNELQQALADIWQELLGIERIGIHDNFFELGGHSLMTIKVVSTIRAKLQAELSIRGFFNNPTVTQLAIHLASAQKEIAPSIGGLQ
jgi:hypothetical protein